MNAIVTVIGKDRVGIMAGVCVAFEKTNVNVLDISQTILKDMFTMNMLVDVKNANVSFSELVDILNKEGERLGVSIRIQREDIFDAMHRIWGAKMLNQHEIIETLNMIDEQHLDIRTITMGISLRNCGHPDAKIAATKMYDKITKYAENLVKTGEEIEKEMGIPIINN